VGIVLPVSAAPESLRYQRLTIDNVNLHVITIDLNDPALLLTPGVATEEPDKRKSFTQFVKDSGCLAQITGTFFDLHNGEPIGDVVVRGRQLVYAAGIGSALVVTPDNIATIIDSPPSPTGWAGFESVLQGGLRLVKDGQPACNPTAQGFHDRYMQRLTARIVVGVLPGNQVVMVETGHVLLPQCAEILIKLGCTDAMALDGGGSTGIAFDGKCIMSTSRKLSNVLMVVRRSPQEIASLREMAHRRQEAQQQDRLQAIARRRENQGIASLPFFHFHIPDFLAFWITVITGKVIG